MANLAGKKLKIKRMIKQGYMISEISHELRVPWGDVKHELASQGISSWTGAKSALTTSIRKLETENDPIVRKKLADDARKWVNFLFENGKELSRQAKNAGGG